MQKKISPERHSLKLGLQTKDPGPGTLGLGTLELGLGNCDPGGLGHGTLMPGTLGLGPWALRLATDPTTDCINFICEANFDNKKHVCRKCKGSNTKNKT